MATFYQVVVIAMPHYLFSSLFVKGLIRTVESIHCYECANCFRNELRLEDCTNLLGLGIESDHCIKTVDEKGEGKP